MVFMVGLLIVIGSIFVFRYIHYNDNPHEFGAAAWIRFLKLVTPIAFFIGFMMAASIFIV